MRKHLAVFAAVLFSIAGVSCAAYAQDPQNQPPPDQEQAQQQPPDQTQNSSQVQPAVARIGYIHGDVSIQRGDSGDWVAATINTPLEAGDRVSTGNGGRAEVQLDYANVIRLDENSTVRISDLTRAHIQVQVGQGLVNYSVFKNSQADSEIDTPNSAVHPLRDGDYRIQVDGDSESQVIVRSGQAEVSEPQGSTRIESGQLITVQGTDNPQYQTAEAPRTDDFDKWNQSRDRVILDAQSWQHTDRYYTGTQDLDGHGHWENVPDYGQVWVPDQDSGWAPYRDGQWVWEPYYGWTWQSNEAWGWAPYHYGRWFVYGGNWAWWPGPVGVYGGWGYYPVWSPAYVSFFGWGGGVDFGFGFGNVGWLPIGPADPFCPWWGFGVSRVSFIGFADRDDFRRGIGDRDFGGRRFDPLFRGRNGFSNISRVENDARIRGGISSVRGNEFGHGDARFQRGIGAGELRQASFMTGRLPVAPTQQSLGRLQRNVSPSIARTASFNNQHFFSQSRPTVTTRPFSEQAARTQRMIADSRTQSRGTMNSSRLPSTPAMQQRNGNERSSMRSSNNSHPTSGPAPSQNGRFNGQPQGSVRPGWHSFGQNGGGQIQPPNRGSQSRDTFQRQATPAQQRPQTPSRPSQPAQQRPSWHPFTQPSRNNGGNGPRQPQAPARFEQQNPRGQQGWSSPRSSGSSPYRQQLDMRQQIASRPSPSYYGRSAPQQRSYNSGRSYGRPGGYSAPARSYGGGGGGRSYSRPSGGGGGGNRGGGSRSSGSRSGGGRPHR